MRRFCPPESSSGERSNSSSSMPVKPAASRTRLSISSSESFMFVGPKAMSLYTVSSKSWYSGYWNTSPTLNLIALRVNLSLLISSPPQSTAPEVGWSSALRCCIKVDFPEPV